MALCGEFRECALIIKDLYGRTTKQHSIPKKKMQFYLPHPKGLRKKVQKKCEKPHIFFLRWKFLYITGVRALVPVSHKEPAIAEKDIALKRKVLEERPRAYLAEGAFFLTYLKLTRMEKTNISSNNNATVNSLLDTTFEAIMTEHSQFLNGWRTLSGIVCGKTHNINGKDVYLYLAHRTEITVDDETNSVSSETHRYFVSAANGKTEYQKEIDINSATESQLVDMLEEALAFFGAEKTDSTDVRIESIDRENRVDEVFEETQEERAAALEWLVERFIADDDYAIQLIDDVDSGKATLDELLLVVKCGLIARYERVTGKSLIDGDPYMAILTLDLLNTRCEQLYDGVGLCDVQPIIDEFGAKRWPVYVGIAKAKKNEMGLDW